jgi:hypothetical protein
MNFLNTYNKRLETRQGRNTAISIQQAAINEKRSAVSNQLSAKMGKMSGDR